MKAVRVLEVVGGLAPGGIENWLLDVYRTIDRVRFRLEFLVHSPENGTVEGALKALGARIHRVGGPHNLPHYVGSFARLLNELGPYDAVHSHVGHFNGIVLRLAWRGGVASRIAHSHSCTGRLGGVGGLLWSTYAKCMRSWIRRFATQGLAVSRLAALSQFGPHWERDTRFRVLHCGIDLEPYRQEVVRNMVRSTLQIPDDAIVIGHIGRFDRAKNHEFILDVAQHLIRREPRAFFLFAGDGPLRAHIDARFRQRGLASRVKNLGFRADIPRLLLGAIDVLLFPSLSEGLGLAAVEGQAAGLPVVLSDVIPKEADVVEVLIHRLSLARHPSEWAELVLSVARAPRGIAQHEALALVERSPFHSRRSVEDLESVYAASRQ